MAAWMIAVIFLGAFAFVGIMIGLTEWRANKHKHKQWWLGR